MDFSEALKALKAGRKVRRKLWLVLSEGIPEEHTALELTRPADGYREGLYAVSQDGTRMAYTASHSQLLAEDWEVVE